MPLENSIDKARTFAIAAHGSQLYGGEPYAVHLAAVVEVAERYWLPPIIQTAAWLHDTLEDTDTTYNDLVDLFGASVADIVYAVTDEPGKNRRARHVATYPKIAAQPAAVALKLCDRIANVEYSIRTGSLGKYAMYRKEHGDFERALRDRSVLPAIWLHLNTLLLPETPAEHSQLQNWQDTPLAKAAQDKQKAS
jgi:guanosine-3',5'-bis(diphosphate) 3'-pyrophosphohydrolase